MAEQAPFWKEKATIKVYVATLILVISFFLRLHYGAEHILPTVGYAVAIGVGGYTLFIRGIRSILQLNFNMTALMTVAILGAAAIGEWGEGALVVILFVISEALERYSMNRARHSISSLMNLSPKEAMILRRNQELVISVDDVQVGDIMLVKPGQKLAMDGVVMQGTASVNQAAITGESIPVLKSIGDEVFAGTLNEDGLLEVMVSKRVEDTTLAKIIHLVEEAQAERAPAQQFVDKFASYYTPIIILAAFLIVIVPPIFYGGTWSEWIYRGLTVLVVGCPCALVISTPVAIVTAIGNAAKHGVLIKGGVHLEAAGTLDVIAFDKTGTLTKGQPLVTDIFVCEHENKSAQDRNALFTIAASIEQASEHPLATAIVRKAVELKLPYKETTMKDFQSMTGRGVKASVDREIYHIGSPAYFKTFQDLANVDAKIANLQSQGKTVILLGTEKSIVLLIAIEDEIRESAVSAITQLAKVGIHNTIMLTGDNLETAAAIASAAGVSEYRANLLPEDKLEIVKELMHRHGNVGMVGDGVNDAPALAAATVGFAMGGASTDAALETADIALLSDDLDKLAYTISISKRTLKIIKQNISLALGLKAIALLLVFPGWLTLWMAIFADMGATLLVTLNSLRLLKNMDK